MKFFDTFCRLPIQSRNKFFASVLLPNFFARDFFTEQQLPVLCSTNDPADKRANHAECFFTACLKIAFRKICLTNTDAAVAAAKYASQTRAQQWLQQNTPHKRGRSSGCSKVCGVVLSGKQARHFVSLFAKRSTRILLPTAPAPVLRQVQPCV